MTNKLNRAKAWCFDKGVSESQVIGAWNNAVNIGVPIVVNLNKHGYMWWWLPPHLLEQLVERHSLVEEHSK